jgi:hypothetical protein
VSYPRALGGIARLFRISKDPTEAMQLSCYIKKNSSEQVIKLRLGSIQVLPSLYSFEGLMVWPLSVHICLILGLYSLFCISKFLSS